MAPPPRRVVADSDDDDDNDEEDIVILDEEGNDSTRGSNGVLATSNNNNDDEDVARETEDRPLSTPQAEPLSPQHLPATAGVDYQSSSSSSLLRGGEAHQRSSDSTSQSVFASIYNAQQDKALQQSRLIENIVRQSHRVVHSGGTISAAAAAGEEEEQQQEGSSSASAGGHPPVVLHPGSDGHEDWHSLDESTGSTTGRGSKKHADNEWDIPSSPEAIGQVMGSPRRRKSAGSGKATRESLGHPAADDGEHQDEPWEQPTLPPAKRQRVSLHNTVGDSAKGFYVAQSNLTTMQKLEYQRVSVGSNSNTEAAAAVVAVAAAATPSAAPPHKSSGATTIAYSTPSRYASSGGRYPWESSMVADPEAEAQREVINIPSSPDIIAQAQVAPSSLPDPEADVPEAVLEDATESPPRSSVRTSSRKKRKSRKLANNEDEADELAGGNDDVWKFEGSQEQEETYKPRPSRRRTKVTTPSKGDTSHYDTAILTAGNDEDELALTQDAEPKSARARKRRHAEPQEEEEKGQVEQEVPHPKAAVPSKKRGRKKKQPPPAEIPDKDAIVADETEVILVEDVDNEHLAENTMAQEEAEQPKKRRGRPKKSAKTKESSTTAKSKAAAKQAEAATSEDDATKEEEKEQQYEPAAQEAEDESKQPRSPSPKRSPLETKDPNLLASPKKKNKQDEKKPEKEEEEEEAKKATDIKSTKTPAAAAKGVAATSLQQPKVQYRVGLSKKSRIAPLLKIIKK